MFVVCSLDVYEFSTTVAVAIVIDTAVNFIIIIIAPSSQYHDYDD